MSGWLNQTLNTKTDIVREWHLKQQDKKKTQFNLKNKHK